MSEYKRGVEDMRDSVKEWFKGRGCPGCMVSVDDVSNRLINSEVTPCEAIDIITNGRHDPVVVTDALNMAVIAIKKQVPMYPDKKGVCPECKSVLGKRAIYCWHCGQKVVQI